MKTKNYILLYDGVCGFCNSTVQLIITHDKKKTMRFAAIQSKFARSVFERHPFLQKIDSLILVEESNTPEEKIYVRSTGALIVARYLGGWWNLFLIGNIVPRILQDWMYDTFATYRYRLFGKYDSCLLPPQEVRSRFIE